MSELEKTQIVRVLDVVAIGPVMIWAAVSTEKLPDWARLFLGISGVATIFYNGRNWLRNQR